ncbi:hypothetical protein D9M72_379240 [compost metagenome]
MGGAPQTFFEQGIEQAEQQRGVLPRTHEQVLVRHGRGFAASRVHDHQLAAPLLQGLQAFFHIRHGHDAAVGGQRVTAEDQHEAGVVDVGDRDQQAMAVHLLADQVMGQLVNRSSGEAPAGLEQAEEVVAVGHQPIVVHARVALIHGHRVVAMARLDIGQALGNQGEGFIPFDG